MCAHYKGIMYYRDHGVIHCPQYHGINHNGVEGIQAEQKNKNVKIDFGLTKIVSFSVADLACAQNVIVRK